jgi:ribokinase
MRAPTAAMPGARQYHPGSGSNCECRTRCGSRPGYAGGVTTRTAAVVGQLARDLVLSIGELPGPGTAADAADRREQLGGKGANQAVALAQLGVRPRLVAVAGDDVIGDVLLDQARADGIDVSTVVRRTGTLTGLIVEVLDARAEYRYVQDLPLLTVADVRGATRALTTADAVLVQLQQPLAAALAAARIGHEAGRLVILDGAPPNTSGSESQAAPSSTSVSAAPSSTSVSAAPSSIGGTGTSAAPSSARAVPAAGGLPVELLAAADVVRADAQEASAWGDPGALLEHGPRLVAFAQQDGGNLVVWRDGRVVVPPTDEKVVDTTGGGDAFVAALTDALLRGLDYVDAACWAVAAAGATVGHAGGRPRLSEADLRYRAAALRRQL